ncbi:hypothetical protein EV182_002074 [Spiromyces aspiralis]|uniref:Uncharacterized protein n=1 Tax=Spiromyces aspiralis TaxID=68401 RepID=A0ACC1HFT1_9FUNG|nr:hypothetical protein EV182_002074 [Spiromyces aspiralis]
MPLDHDDGGEPIMGQRTTQASGGVAIRPSVPDTQDRNDDSADGSEGEEEEIEEGIDTDTPFIQLDNATFKGYYDESLGTQLIFEPQNDGGENPRTARFITKTTKVMRLNGVMLKPKNVAELERDGSSRDQETIVPPGGQDIGQSTS